MTIELTEEEQDVLRNWKKRSDTLILVRLKAEAILYASRRVDTSIIADMVDRTERTVRDWLTQWQVTRLQSVVTGHANNQNAAKLTRAQKQELTTILATPPSDNGVNAAFWDVPAMHDVVKTRFDVEYQSDSSYQLLLKFCGMSFTLPDRYDTRRDETAITERMTQVKTHVADLLTQGWEVYTVDEVRVEHEAETRRMWLPKGQHTKLYVDRKKASQTFFGALSLTSKTMKLYPLEGRQNAEHIILALHRLQQETSNNRIAVVLDNARFHHAKALTNLYKPGQTLERITPIYLPPYAPDHNPTEHVWNTAKHHIANLQRDTPEETFTALSTYITNHTFDYTFEHLPTTPPTETLFNAGHTTERKAIS